MEKTRATWFFSGIGLPNAAIRRWQQHLAASPAFGAENLEELASHLRASAQRLKDAGLSEEESFLIASRRLGAADELSDEFSKVNRGFVWRARALWMFGGMLLFLVASDFSGLISDAVTGLCSPFVANGTLLGWIWGAGWFLAIVFVAYLFHLVAASRLIGLIGIAASTARLLQRRWIAVTVLLFGVMTLKIGRGLVLWKCFQPHSATFGPGYYQIRTYLSMLGGLAVIIFILISLTKPASGKIRSSIKAQAGDPANP